MSYVFTFKFLHLTVPSWKISTNGLKAERDGSGDKYQARNLRFACVQIQDRRTSGQLPVFIVHAIILNNHSQ